MEPCVVGIDLGGTKVAGAAADLEGRIICRETVATPGKGGREVLEAVTALAAGLAAGKDLKGIGLGVPGVVDLDRGVVVAAGNIKWKQVAVVVHLQKRFPGASIVMDNDVNAAARGERRWGAARGFHDFIYVTVGTGIGGGIYTAGRLLQGPRWAAGEVGHMVMDPDGLPCTCGGTGCLETLAAAPAFVREGIREAQRFPGSLLHSMMAAEGGSLTAEMVSRACEEGDQAAVEAFNRCARWLGTGMASLVNIFNPSLLVMGGGVSLAGEMLLRIIRERIKRYGMEVQSGHVGVVSSKLGDGAGLFGALDLALPPERQ